MLDRPAPTVRVIRFEYPDDFDPNWHPRLPEFAATANAVSLMMPHVEPYIARSVRATIDELPAELAAEAKAYAGQELQHQAQHRRLNDHVIAAAPSVARLDRWMARIIGWLERTRSADFHLAFAAGFETIAYAGARWVDERTHSLLDDSDDVASTLFLWHLAEEIEHKTVAFDVFKDRSTSTRAHIAGTVVAGLFLALFTILGSIALLAKNRRLFNPMALGRLTVWAVSFAFEMVPAMVLSLLRGHDPRHLSDPAWMALWLQEFDAETGELPIWHQLGRS